MLPCLPSKLLSHRPPEAVPTAERQLLILQSLDDALDLLRGGQLSQPRVERARGVEL